jgi:hypothetical protein
VADDRSVYSAGQVVLANITTHPDGWHGWWSCSGPGSREHWERGAIKRRLDATGSVTP